MILKVMCKGCRVIMGVKTFELHKVDCRPSQPGDRFFASGKEFREKPDLPAELDPPPITVVKIIFRVFSYPPAPMLISDALNLLKKGKLHRVSLFNLKEFYVVDETEILLEGNELEQLLEKARRAGGRV